VRKFIGCNAGEITGGLTGRNYRADRGGTVIRLGKGGAERAQFSPEYKGIIAMCAVSGRFPDQECPIRSLTHPIIYFFPANE